MQLDHKPNVVLALSGGMDSSTLLLHLLAQGANVTALSFDYGQKHRVELERAKSLVEYIGSISSNSYKLKYNVIKLDGLSNLLNSTLVQGGGEVPEGYYAEDNQRETVVPNRNKIFSSILQAVALSQVKLFGNTSYIALGIHAGDFSVYPDCRQEFRDLDEQAFRSGNWDSEYVRYYTPYIDLMKADILKDGFECCNKLGLDFDEVYRRTNTSYKPYPSGNSDYKSASSVERILGFVQLGRPDPVQYEDETGPVSWEVAKNHAIKVEQEFLNRNK